MADISVIVPVYNVKNELRACVASVQRQQGAAWELLLVDDGSTDGSGALCDELARDVGAVRVIHQANGGLSAARNAGLSAAQGEYVLFLDGDDFYTNPEALLLLLRAARAENADMVCFNYCRCTAEGKAAGGALTAFPAQPAVNEAYDARLLRLVEANAYLSSACFKLVRRSVIEKAALRFAVGALSEDIEWSARLMTQCESITWVPDTLYAYRLRPHSITKTVSPENVRHQLAAVTTIERMTAPEVLRPALLGYAAFQYSALLINMNLARPKVSPAERQAVRAQSGLLQYGRCGIVRLIRRVYAVCGFALTARLLCVYFKLFRSGAQ